jgi:hypothetical protein
MKPRARAHRATPRLLRAAARIGEQARMEHAMSHSYQMTRRAAQRGSLSLSLTHTHTHNRARARNIQHTHVYILCEYHWVCTGISSQP